jgi:hypothetical protein
MVSRLSESLRLPDGTPNTSSSDALKPDRVIIQ